MLIFYVFLISEPFILKKTLSTYIKVRNQLIIHWPGKRESNSSNEL